MKKLLVWCLFLVVFCGVYSSAICSGKEKEIKLSQIPEKVKAVAERVFPGGTLQCRSHRQDTCAGSNRCPRKKTGASQANTKAI